MWLFVSIVRRLVNWWTHSSCAYDLELLEDKWRTPCNGIWCWKITYHKGRKHKKDFTERTEIEEETTGRRNVHRERCCLDVSFVSGSQEQKVKEKWCGGKILRVNMIDRCMWLTAASSYRSLIPGQHQWCLSSVTFTDVMTVLAASHGFSSFHMPSSLAKQSSYSTGEVLGVIIKAIVFDSCIY